MGKNRRDQERKKYWRAYQGMARCTIEHIIFDQKERTCLAQPDCVDRTVRQYQPDETNLPVTETYINSWILKPTELVANDSNISITSGSQTTFVKAKYLSTGQIIVQAQTSHATPSSHRYTWTDPQESPVTLDESNKPTDG
jgi:hypothetical protein